MENSLCRFSLQVLNEPDPWKKSEKTIEFAKEWLENDDMMIGSNEVPDRPARPQKPELKLPKDMPKRRKAGSKAGKIALLHALAHIELNAIDLAWDLMARFNKYSWQHVKRNEFSLPREFYNDWVKVADDEARHFLMLSERLRDFGVEYGDLPAHDGLWESAIKTSHDFAARLAVVPMVLEARGLDVTPAMADAMEKQGDIKTANMIRIIHDEEITHVAAGRRWFQHWCDFHGYAIDEYWQKLVRKYFNGNLKRPFNHDSRFEAGMLRHWYEPLSV